MVILNFLWDKVTEWLKELLIGSIMSNLTGLFDNVNRQVAGIADNVGATPQAWNGGIRKRVTVTGLYHWSVKIVSLQSSQNE